MLCFACYAMLAPRAQVLVGWLLVVTVLSWKPLSCPWKVGPGHRSAVQFVRHLDPSIPYLYFCTSDKPRTGSRSREGGPSRIRRPEKSEERVFDPFPLWKNTVFTPFEPP